MNDGTSVPTATSYTRLVRCQELLAFWRWLSVILIALILLLVIQLTKLDRLCRSTHPAPVAVLLQEGGQQ